MNKPRIFHLTILKYSLKSSQRSPCQKIARDASRLKVRGPVGTSDVVISCSTDFPSCFHCTAPVEAVLSSQFAETLWGPQPENLQIGTGSCTEALKFPGLKVGATQFFILFVLINLVLWKTGRFLSSRKLHYPRVEETFVQNMGSRQTSFRPGNKIPVSEVDRVKEEEEKQKWEIEHRCLKRTGTCCSRERWGSLSTRSISETNNKKMKMRKIAEELNYVEIFGCLLSFFRRHHTVDGRLTREHKHRACGGW